MFDVSPGSFFVRDIFICGSTIHQKFLFEWGKILAGEELLNRKVKEGSHQRIVSEKELWMNKTSRNDVMVKKVRKYDRGNFITENTFSKQRQHTHKIWIHDFFFFFFFNNDTVVDAQIFIIFEHHQSILYVFLGQNLLICSSPARILLCKFLKELFFARNSLSFEQKTSNFQYLSIFWFLRLHYATCFGNLEEMTHNLNLRNIIFSPFGSMFFICVNRFWLQNLITFRKRSNYCKNTSPKENVTHCYFFQSKRALFE